MGDKTDRLRGQAKETAGQGTGDPKLAQEGRRDQAKGTLTISSETTRSTISGVSAYLGGRG